MVSDSYEFMYPYSVRGGRLFGKLADLTYTQIDQQEDRWTDWQSSRLVINRQIDLQTDRGQGLAAGGRQAIE